ncbi:MAG: outer membrane lipoprotein-sorting protein [Rhodobacteraceae bacterium]|nr:outer membrane lipoprotein-sorting protein [Paracoccaceae bacterium]
MNMPTRRHFILLATAAMIMPNIALAQDAAGILRAAYNNWRADSSHAIVEMTIRRSNGDRNLTMESWTMGDDKGLVRFTAPARDAGNATLQIGNRTWVYNPKLSQVIQLPASAMTQSWMGSDFSYDDMTQTEDSVDDYDHTLLETRRSGGRNIYVIESVPKRGKPIVWGKLIITIRDDFVIMRQDFYDQRGALVRSMITDRVSNIDGRPYPTVMTMTSAAKPGEWTRMTTVSAEFNIAIPNYLFTRSNLQNPRD